MFRKELYKPGETRPLDRQRYLWLQGLLRYTRDTEIATNVKRGLPNITTVFAGYSSEYQQGKLTLLFSSYDHTDHSQVIMQSLRWPRRRRTLQQGNISLKLVNSASPEINLMMTGLAVPVPESETAGALAEFNRIRQLKQTPEIASIGPKSDEDLSPRRFYAVTILSAKTQGERWSPRGNHIGEGHPPVDIARLLGFENMPALANGEAVPNTKRELKNHLFRRGYSFV